MKFASKAVALEARLAPDIVVGHGHDRFPTSLCIEQLLLVVQD